MEGSIFKGSLVKDESESSISKSEGIVVYNGKNGRIKQDRTERGLMASLSSPQWLPLHYNWLRYGGG